MSEAIRRVVVANSDQGRAILVSDERIETVSRGVSYNIVGAEMWSTSGMPVDNANKADDEQRRSYTKVFNDYNHVASGQGTAFWITQREPRHAIFTHSTQTLNYDVVLSGNIDLELDGGEVFHLSMGDVVIMRRCRQTWVNRSDKPAVTAFMFIDAKPVPGSSGPLGVEFPAPAQG